MAAYRVVFAAKETEARSHLESVLDSIPLIEGRITESVTAGGQVHLYLSLTEGHPKEATLLHNMLERFDTYEYITRQQREAATEQSH